MSFVRMAAITATVVGVVIGGTLLLTNPKHVAPVVASTEEVVILEDRADQSIAQPEIAPVPHVTEKPVKRAVTKKVRLHRVVKRRAAAPVPASPVEHCNWIARCVETDPATGLVTKEPGYLAK